MLHEVAAHESVSLDNLEPMSFEPVPLPTASENGPTEDDLLIDDAQFVSLEEEA